jgi:DNA modification methylase
MAKTNPFARLDWEGRTEDLPPATDLTHISTVFLQDEWIEVQPSASNTLIHGENLEVMLSLLPTYRDQVDLIYADPPFLSGKTYTTRIGREEDSRQPSKWRQIEGFQDQWKDGSEYLAMLYPRLRVMYQLLSPTGTLYLHLDWHAAAYARILLDEIFGPDRLLNEIVWTYHGPSPIRSAFKRKHDTILVYTKSDRYTFNADAVRIPYDPATHKTFQSSKKAGFGKTPDLARGKVPEDWWYFPVVARLHNERTGFPTQKPEALLERIILASSNPSDLVADFFCGSGTTPIVSQRLGRKWIACDAAEMALLTTRRRILLEQQSPSFRFLQQSGLNPSEELSLIIEIEQEDSGTTIHLKDLVSTLERTSELHDVVLWEVDWEHLGMPYRMTSHACLPWRKGTITHSLSHEYVTSGPRDVAVWAVTASGKAGRWRQAISV